MHLYAMPPAASTRIGVGRLTGVDAQSFREDTTLSWPAGRCASRRTGHGQRLVLRIFHAPCSFTRLTDSPYFLSADFPR